MFMFLFGLCLIVCLLGLPALAIGILRDSDTVVDGSFWTMLTAGSFSIIFLVIGMLLSGGEPQFVAGHCYEAIRTESNSFITVSTGKSVVIVPTHTTGISMQEIDCP